jgi:IS5 family transposase
MLSPHKGASIHLDRGYDSFVTRERLKERGLDARIAKKGQQSAPLQAGQRWVERTNSWHNGPPVTPLGGAWLQKVAGDVPP